MWGGVRLYCFRGVGGDRQSKNTTKKLTHERAHARTRWSFRLLPFLFLLFVHTWMLVGNYFWVVHRFVLGLIFERYSGASAARVWGSIYWENLRGYQDNACMEKRILFRLLSGLHSSIMTQIANQYRFDGERGRGGGMGSLGLALGLALVFLAGAHVPFLCFWAHAVFAFLFGVAIPVICFN